MSLLHYVVTATSFDGAVAEEQTKACRAPIFLQQHGFNAIMLLLSSGSPCLPLFLHDENLVGRSVRQFSSRISIWHWCKRCWDIPSSHAHKIHTYMWAYVLRPPTWTWALGCTEKTIRSALLAAQACKSFSFWHPWVLSASLHYGVPLSLAVVGPWLQEISPSLY